MKYGIVWVLQNLDVETKLSVTPFSYCQQLLIQHVYTRLCRLIPHKSLSLCSFSYKSNRNKSMIASNLIWPSLYVISIDGLCYDSMCRLTKFQNSISVEINSLTGLARHYGFIFGSVNGLPIGSIYHGYLWLYSAWCKSENPLQTWDIRYFLGLW